ARAVEALTRVVEARPGAARAAADLNLLEDTRLQLGFLSEASADVAAPRFVASSTGDEVPVAGRAGFHLEFSASQTAREMFGNGPSLADGEPDASAKSSFWDLKPEPARGFRRMNPGADAE